LAIVFSSIFCLTIEFTLVSTLTTVLVNMFCFWFNSVWTWVVDWLFASNWTFWVFKDWISAIRFFISVVFEIILFLKVICTKFPGLEGGGYPGLKCAES
jgi:hypothetical protein